MVSSSSHLLPVLLIIICISMVTQVVSRPSSRKPDSQILKNLFGSEISSLLLAEPEVTEGSAQGPEGRGPTVSSVGVEPRKAMPRFFLDLLNRQRMRGRGRKTSGRGCFGMKVDRIGALSGMGC